MRGNIGAGIFDTISIGPKRRLCGFYSVVAKTVLYLSTTWLRVALLHSPASASTALPGFFMGGMSDEHAPKLEHRIKSHIRMPAMIDAGIAKMDAELAAPTGAISVERVTESLARLREARQETDTRLRTYMQRDVEAKLRGE